MEAVQERLALGATIDPASIAPGAVTTDVIDFKLVRRALFVVAVGALGASATVDFEIDGDTAANGAFTTKLTGKSIAPLTKAAGDDNKQALIEVTAQEASAQGFRYVRGKLTVGASASQACVIALVDGLRYAPAKDYDLASVV